MTEKVVCGDCEHFFDPTDKRCHIPSPDPRYSPTCPACTLMTLQGVEAWSVWNDCQGIFTCGVGHSKADAEAHLISGRYDGAGCRVVPIRIYAEPEDRIDMREWSERQSRKVR